MSVNTISTVHEQAISTAVQAAKVENVAPQRSRRFIACKRLLQQAFLLPAGPRLVVYAIAKAVVGSRAFSAASESIARVPGLRGVYLRQAFYRRTITRCGEDCYFGWMSVLS